MNTFSQKNTGDILLESLIGVLIMSILAMGVAYCAKQLFIAKADTKIINNSVFQLKSLLENKGQSLCNTTPQITVFNKQVDVHVTCIEQSLVVQTSSYSSTIVSPQKIILQLDPQSLGLKGETAVIVSTGDNTIE